MATCSSSWRWCAATTTPMPPTPEHPLDAVLAGEDVALPLHQRLRCRTDYRHKFPYGPPSSSNPPPAASSMGGRSSGNHHTGPGHGASVGVAPRRRPGGPRRSRRACHHSRHGTAIEQGRRRCNHRQTGARSPSLLATPYSPEKPMHCHGKTSRSVLACWLVLAAPVLAACTAARDYPHEPADASPDDDVRTDSGVTDDDGGADVAVGTRGPSSSSPRTPTTKPSGWPAPSCRRRTRAVPSTSSS